MSWICKKCGGEIVEIAIVPTTVVRTIKRDGKAGKIIMQGKHKIAHSKDFKCLDCGVEASATYMGSLKQIAVFKEDK